MAFRIRTSFGSDPSYKNISSRGMWQTSLILMCLYLPLWGKEKVYTLIPPNLDVCIFASLRSIGKEILHHILSSHCLAPKCALAPLSWGNETGSKIGWTGVDDDEIRWFTLPMLCWFSQRTRNDCTVYTFGVSQTHTMSAFWVLEGRVSSRIKRSHFDDRQLGLCVWWKLSTYILSFALHSTTINTKVGENTEKYK